MRATNRPRIGQQTTPTLVRRRRRAAPILAVLSIATVVSLGITPLAQSAVDPLPDAVVKTANPPSLSSVTPGQVITYTIAVIRGNIPREGDWTVEDNLSHVLDHATLVGSWPANTNFTESGSGSAMLEWQVPDLEPGQTASISYQVRVNDDANGAELRNKILSYGTDCAPILTRQTAESPDEPVEIRCTTSHRVIAVAPPVVTVPAPAKPPVVRVPRSLPHTGA